MDLKHRGSTNNDPNGHHANEIDYSIRARVGCPDRDDEINHEHPNKQKRSVFTFKTVMCICLSAGVIFVGKEYLDRSFYSLGTHDKKIPDPEPLRPAPQTIHLPVPDLTLSIEEKKIQPRQPLYGKMTYGLYRLKASQLGHHYVKAIEFFEDWIGHDVDPEGAQFAKKRVQLPGVAEYYNECYQTPQEARMITMEEKTINNKRLHEQRKTSVFDDHEVFFNVSNYKEEEIFQVIADGQWTWRAAAVFSSQYSNVRTKFRKQFHHMLKKDKFLAGAGLTGVHWYPPNAVREWHTNKWEVATDEKTGQMIQPWRMYFVRQKPASTNHSDMTDKSAFHVLDGNGIPPERLEEIGAYQLTHNNNEPNAWRLPDRSGYVTLFRLQVDEPYRWHCIVAGETVHRYSLGMRLSDADVEALLEHVGVEF